MRAANNIYSRKSHAIKFKKTAKTNEFLHRIHALKNKAKDIFCVADWSEDYTICICDDKLSVTGAVK